MGDVKQGLIMYGPPAAGKDTITRALSELDPSFVPFPRLKSGRGRRAGYRMADEETIVALRRNGDVIWENRRYGATYVVDRTELIRRISEHIPVLHLGQVEAIEAVRAAIPGTCWHIVYIWCSREIAEQRIVARETGDVTHRLRAWDETRPLADAHLFLDTGTVSAGEAARQVQRIARCRRLAR